jgi:hypothetical protein
VDRRVLDSPLRVGEHGSAMGGWLLGLSVAWLALLVLGATTLVTGGLYAGVIALSRDDRWGAAFKTFSPGMLPPLGLLFGLVVGFLVAQVWSDADRAQQAVNREASSLRAVDLLANEFQAVSAARLHALVRRHIETAVRNWVKWLGVLLLAALTLVATCFVHSGNRLSAALAMGVFAGAAAIVIVMIAAQDRPFAGQLRVKPDPLVQVASPRANRSGRAGDRDAAPAPSG